MVKTYYYAVAKGYQVGIFNVWEKCKSSVEHFPNARYKKFSTKSEAENFIRTFQPNISDVPCFCDSTTIHNVSKKQEQEDKQEQKEKDVECSNDELYVYTDGACMNNGYKNACAGIGIFFGKNDPRNVSKRIDGKQTNNVAELLAIIEAYPIIKKDVLLGKRVTIVSDSTYAIQCATTYGEKNHKSNWEKEIPNKELVKEIYNLYKNHNNVSFMYIAAHTNKQDRHSIGNQYADELAVFATQL